LLQRISYTRDDMATPKPPNNAGNKSKHLEGRYVNYFEIGHSPFEFIFDFGQYHPETDCARMHSRIVMGPVYAKLLANLLGNAVLRFEQEHGVIQQAEDELDPMELVKQSIADFDHQFNGMKKTED
jgi:Protein of unknown function (DUF3467)